MPDLQDILKQAEAIGTEARASLARISDAPGIAAWHQEYLSKKGKITALQKSVGAVKEIESRKQIGKAVNELGTALKTAFDEHQEKGCSG